MKISDQRRLEKNIRQICSNWWIPLEAEDFNIKELIKEKQTSIECKVQFGKRGKKEINIEGNGKGAVDAFYRSIVDELSEEYSSLRDIKFKKFLIKSDIKSKAPGSDATVEATLRLLNARDQEFEFVSESHSMNVAAINVVLKAVEFFVNSHIAMSKTYISLKDARERNRSDLIEKYTLQMADLVKVTSYVEVINKFKKESK